MAAKSAQKKLGLAPKLDQGTQLNRLRSVCCATPGTIEKISHGEPTFNAISLSSNVVLHAETSLRDVFQ